MNTFKSIDLALIGYFPNFQGYTINFMTTQLEAIIKILFGFKFYFSSNSITLIIQMMPIQA